MELFFSILDLFSDIIKSSIWIATIAWILLGLFFVFLIDLSWKMIVEKDSPKWSRALGLVFFITGMFELLFVFAASFSK